jgi:hypothetical protein
VLPAEWVKAAESRVELLQNQKQNVVIQQFVAERKGRAIRASASAAADPDGRRWRGYSSSASTETCMRRDLAGGPNWL